MELDREADQRYRMLIREIKEKEGLRDEMKQYLLPTWKMRMKKVINIAEMIILKEFVYVSPRL